MTSVDDVYAAASDAEHPLEEAQRQVVAASQQTGEVVAGLRAAEDAAAQFAQACNAVGLEATTAEAEAVRTGLEELAARASSAVDRLTTEAAELAAIKQAHSELLARIQALSG